MGHARSRLAVKLLIRPAAPAWAGAVITVGQVQPKAPNGASLDTGHDRDHQPILTVSIRPQSGLLDQRFPPESHSSTSGSGRLLFGGTFPLIE